MDAHRGELPNPEPIDKMRQAAEACLEENKGNLESVSDNRYVVRRQAMARDAMARLRVLDQFSTDGGPDP